MITHKPPSPQTARTVAAILVAVAVLHFAEDVLVPVALAVLLAFLLGPLVARIESRGLPRPVAVGLTTAVAFALIGALVYTVAYQFMGLVEDLPLYRDNILEKVRSLSGQGTSDIERGVETVKEIGDELAKASPGAERARPIPEVRVVEPPPSAAEVVSTVVGPLVRPVSTLAIVVVFVIFMLLQREDLRDRLVRLLGASQMPATVAALDDAARRVSRYLAMQFLINTIQGVLVAAGLWLIGVPDAVLWGALTIVLRFIPYLGPVLAAAGPITVAIAFFPGWTYPLLAAGWIGTLELVSNNFLEPRLYGASIGVSSFALIVAAVFWTWLWGTAGLFLSAPLTVCLVVIGKYIPQFGFLAVMLGDQPVLQPHERFYQRLLADDPDEAEELFDQTVAERPLVDVADDLVLPALRLARHDHDRGAIDAARRDAVVEHVGGWVEDVPSETPDPGRAPDGTPLPRLRVLCLPAVDRADEVAAVLLARALAPRGIDMEVVAAGTLKAEMLERVAQSRPDVVCISAAPPATVVHARYLCKKLRAVSQAPVVVGLWDAQGDLTRARERLAAVGARRVVSTAAELADDLDERLQAMRQVACAAPATAEQTAPSPG